jgi:hypothetical protein
MAQLVSATSDRGNHVDDEKRASVAGDAWTTDAISFGVAIFKGQTKIAIVGCDERIGRLDDGTALMRRMLESSWRVTLTSPIQSPDNLREILKILDALSKQ